MPRLTSSAHTVGGQVPIGHGVITRGAQERCLFVASAFRGSQAAVKIVPLCAALVHPMSQKDLEGEQPQDYDQKAPSPRHGLQGAPPWSFGRPGQGSRMAPFFGWMAQRWPWFGDVAFRCNEVSDGPYFHKLRFFASHIVGAMAFLRSHHMGNFTSKARIS